MNKRTKATLSSTLVFPGAGQFLQNKYLLGGVLAGMAFISLCVIFMNIVQCSLMIVDKIQQREILLDRGTIFSISFRSTNYSREWFYRKYSLNSVTINMDNQYC